jgi:hypothetical protein
MTTLMQTGTADVRFHDASEHLYNALRDAFGRSLGADQPIVRAISEYGQACRSGADWHEASEHVYRALRFHLGGTWGAHQPIIKALSEYGQACRAMGAKAA